MTFRLRKFLDVSERIVMGILAGFVALLFIEGGKVLFLVEMNPGVQHNPFSGAFIGFLAGLLTEKVSQYLKIWSTMSPTMVTKITK